MAAQAALAACLALVFAGAAVQVAVGAGLSVVAGTAMLLWLGRPSLAVLVALNLLVSVVAAVVDARRVMWRDAGLVAAATLVGCGLASAVPGLSDAALRAATAAVLALAAMPRPGRTAPSPRGHAAAALAAAGAVTGALTVWTGTPGPVTPIAFARAGRDGADIRRTMQPISVVGYGAAAVIIGLPDAAAVGPGRLAALAAATLAGTLAGFPLRARIDAAQVVALIRATAAAAAALLVVSLLV